MGKILAMSDTLKSEEKCIQLFFSILNSPQHFELAISVQNDLLGFTDHGFDVARKNEQGVHETEVRNGVVQRKILFLFIVC